VARLNRFHDVHHVDGSKYPVVALAGEFVQDAELDQVIDHPCRVYHGDFKTRRGIRDGHDGPLEQTVKKLVDCAGPAPCLDLPMRVVAPLYESLRASA